MKKATRDRRRRGNRRWGLEKGFPLKDSDGVVIVAERRTLSDRRLDNTTLEERLLMFSGMTPVEDD